MKKKNLKSLNLNRKAISNLEFSNEVKGGGLRTIQDCSHLQTCPLGPCNMSGQNQSDCNDC